ncbi:Single-strand binding protein [Metamycoplasma alkalescens 14918]|uniref:Single-strand binding protein n=1 Tax=Metamycoplasma alkalescens 14918 TaxID=1188234 RepID=N9U9L7_9BACT|nr:single-stranded DNA-binding protein [Metamycoplasma alkalescens]ENY53623.1 Single-strand binding protein [Metamycoplasma alkalescens 14918]
MNKVILVGKLITEPYKGFSTIGQEYSKFTISASQDANSKPEFIPCSAWNAIASFVNKYLKNGDLVEIEGHFTRGQKFDIPNKTIYTYFVTIGKIRHLKTHNLSFAQDSQLQNQSSPQLVIDDSTIFPIETKTYETINHSSSNFDDGLTWDG